MYRVRLWVVRHSRFFERIYHTFEPLLVKFHPLFNRLGYSRAEGPVKFVEKGIKGLMFDCQMCGQCALSSTGMSCPMNCPKSIRNGPCGGVRPNGHCEVKPEMRCVWVEGWEGSKRMKHGELIHVVQQPVDNRLKDTSSWLRVVRDKAVHMHEPDKGTVK